MPKLKATELAYAAGLVDGEGYLHLWRRPPRKAHYAAGYCPRLQVQMTDELVVRWLHEKFGGRLYNYAPSKGGRRRTWRWHIAGQDALAAIETLLPHLRVKREQALLMLQFRELATVGVRPTPELQAKREALRTAIMRLCYGPTGQVAA